MNNGQPESLCLSLMQADSEQEVIKILKDAGYWDDPKVWRDYGDDEHNWEPAEQARRRTYGEDRQFH